MGRKEPNIMPIGLDLGHHAAKLVQLSAGKGGMELMACATVPIPEHLLTDRNGRLDFLAHHIPQALKSAPFKGRECVVALPAEEVFIRHVRIRRADAKTTDLLVRQAIQSELPFPISDAMIRHMVVKEVYNENEACQEIIVLAAPLPVVNLYANMIRRAKLRVSRVTLRSEAITRCFSSLTEWGRDPEKATLYVDLGSSHTQVAISRGSTIVFARSLEHGVASVDQSISAALNIAPPQAWQLRLKLQMQQGTEKEEALYRESLQTWLEPVSEELTRSLRYYQTIFRGETVSRVVFTGGQARDWRLCQAMSQLLELPAQIGDPLAGVHAGGWFPPPGSPDYHPRPELTVAVGLSLSTPQAANGSVNMLPDQIVRQEVQYRLDAICVVLFAIAMASIVTTEYNSREHLRTTRAVYENASVRFAEAADFMKKFFTLQSQRNELLRQAQGVSALEERIPRSCLLAVITNAKPAKMYLEAIDMNTMYRVAPVTAKVGQKSSEEIIEKPAKTEKGTPVVAVDVCGVAEDNDQVAQFIAGLKASVIVRTVELKYTLATKIEEQPRQRFQIHMELKDIDLLDAVAASQPAKTTATKAARTKGATP